jgi:prephenate dehydratase
LNLVMAPLLGFLGPEGTFAHAAAAAARTVGEVDSRPFTDVESIADGVESGALRFGVVPIENSVHGYVLPTLDQLVFVNRGVLVREEVVLEVGFSLFGRSSGSTDAAVVLSHPHALAQCRRLIAARGLRTEETASTAEACRIVAEERPEALCIAAPHAGALYGLTEVAAGVQDRAGGRTRFYVLAQSLAPERSDATFHTALVLTPVRDRPGILLEMLRPFAERGVNLSSLMSRPLRSSLGLYCFWVVVDVPISDKRLRAALSELLDGGVRVKNLGSYLAWPSAPPLAGAHADVPPGSVAASDPPAEQARALAPRRDEE